MDILWTRFDSWCICCQNVRHKFDKIFFLASVISLVFLCSVCSAILYFSLIFCFFLLISWNNTWAREIYYGQMIKKRSCLV